MLSIADHRRDRAGLRYVYPVVSRRAGGVSVGINLNVNNACNWACAYCQVENLVRGGPPPIDLALLEHELAGFLDELLHGDYLFREVPAEARRLADIAFSGNGEPTSAAEFCEAVQCVAQALKRFEIFGTLPVRLITNGSLMHRPRVRQGIEVLADMGGEVWFKIDRALPEEVQLINGVPLDVEGVRRRLAISCEAATTWVQTCWFAIDGHEPGADSRAAYCEQLRPLAKQVAGVHLYGLARPSLQPMAGRLGRIEEAALLVFAQEIEKTTGLRVVVSP